MNHLLKYKLFESESDDDTIENIELCKDFIETFNESDDEFNISNYVQGWYNGQFSNDQKGEKDKVALYFNIGMKKHLEEEWFRDFSKPTSIDELDDMGKILSKSKFLLSRLQRYCQNIIFSTGKSDISANFILIFDNTDSNNKKDAICKRIRSSLTYMFKDYDRHKTIFLGIREDNPTIFLGIREDNPKLSDLISNNKVLSNWNPKHDYLQLRYTLMDTVENNTISFRVGPFKYKTSKMDKFKPIRLDNEERDEVVKIVFDKIEQKLSPNDIKLIDMSSSGM